MRHDKPDTNFTDAITNVNLRQRDTGAPLFLDPLTQPDCVLPSQYFANRASTPVEGEIRLLIAVLQDAMNIYARTRGRKTRAQVEQFAEVRAWFEATGEHGLYGFESVCEILGIEPGRLRRWLKSWFADGAAAQQPAAASRGRHSSRRGWRLNLGRPRAPGLQKRSRSHARRRAVEQAGPYRPLEPPQSMAAKYA